MNPLDKLNEELVECRIKLDSCIKYIKNSELENEVHIKNIGHALSYIFDIQNGIYQIQPELTPTYLKEPAYDKEYIDKFGDLILEVDSLCEKGKQRKAIKKIKVFIKDKPPKAFIKMAKDKIETISERNNT